LTPTDALSFLRFSRIHNMNPTAFIGYCHEDVRNILDYVANKTSIFYEPTLEIEGLTAAVKQSMLDLL
jgi:hypothetical protein